MNYKVVTFDYFGKSDIAIVDENFLPVCGFLNNHISSTYQFNALNTKWTYAHALLFIYRYFESQNIDLIERVQNGIFLTGAEFDYFKRHCMYSASNENEVSNVLDFSKLSDKRLDSMIHVSKSAKNRVTAVTVKLRLGQLKSYINYLYNIWHYGNQPPISISNAHIDFERVIKKTLKGIRADNAKVLDPFESEFPDSVFLRMLEICKPSHEENPFKGSRLRNFVIISIWCDTGIREGALGKLKISDIKDDWDKPRLMITRTPNDPTDPRKKKAAQKTKAHVSAITTETMASLKHYLATCREKVIQGNTHDFIFVSEKGKTKGKPLALKSLYNITVTLSKALNFKVHPHLLRHKWNEIFDRKATALGYKPEVIEDIRKYANGWSENSESSQVYNQFRNALKNQEISSVRQNDFINSKGNQIDE